MENWREVGGGRGRVGGDNIRPICFVAHTEVSQHKVGKCCYKPYLQFHGFLPNQVVFVVVVLQILSIMGGGVRSSFEKLNFTAFSD